MLLLPDYALVGCLCFVKSASLFVGQFLWLLAHDLFCNTQGLVMWEIVVFYYLSQVNVTKADYHFKSFRKCTCHVLQQTFQELLYKVLLPWLVYVHMM
jgi:hypothetical protein